VPFYFAPSRRSEEPSIVRPFSGQFEDLRADGGRKTQRSLSLITEGGVTRDRRRALIILIFCAKSKRMLKVKYLQDLISVNQTSADVA
jgi:hypothetical protein